MKLAERNFWAALAVSSGLLASQPSEAFSQANPVEQKPVVTSRVNIEENKWLKDERDLIELLNKERQKLGLFPLKVDKKVMEVARKRAYDQIALTDRSISHGLSNYVFYLLDDAVSRGKFAGIMGENLARIHNPLIYKGKPAPEELYQAWWNSPGHRINMLGAYEYIGAAIIDDPRIKVKWDGQDANLILIGVQIFA